MRIVRLVAIDALRAHAFPGLTLVASRALDFGVRSEQCKRGGAVIERHVVPPLGAVARHTIFTQPPEMRIVLPVACYAFMRRFRIALVCLVAVGAIDIRMLVIEPKVRERVVEGGLFQPHNIEVPALMFCVAGLAFYAADIR